MSIHPFFRHRRAQALALLLLAAPCAALAQDDTGRLGELRAELEAVRQEQQSVYQNYEMIKDLRRMEVQQASPPMSQQPYGTDLYTPPPGYYDVLRQQAEREQRILQYTSDLSILADRYFRLETRRSQLAVQIRALEQPH